MIEWLTGLIGSAAGADVIGAAAAVLVIVFIAQACAALWHVIELIPRVGGGKI